MKNFKFLFGLVLVILLSNISCSESHFEENINDIQLRENEPVIPADSIPSPGVDPRETGKGN
ncbi:hypothetical protein ACSSV5_000511 [Psychroflexus sp. MBR-150]|jgi:hypothetical protein